MPNTDIDDGVQNCPYRKAAAVEVIHVKGIVIVMQ